MADDGDDGDYYHWLEAEDESECGEHCVTLTLMQGPGGKDRIMERHCNCPWCHAGVEQDG